MDKNIDKNNEKIKKMEELIREIEKHNYTSPVSSTNIIPIGNAVSALSNRSR